MSGLGLSLHTKESIATKCLLKKHSRTDGQQQLLGLESWVVNVLGSTIECFVVEPSGSILILTVRNNSTN